MFRPIRNDTPKGKAAQKFEGGLSLMLLCAPALAVSYAYDVLAAGHSILQPWSESSGVLPPILVFPMVTVLLGLMLAYDGWWHLRHL